MKNIKNGRYGSEVRFLLWKLPVERYYVDSLDNVNDINKFILKHIRPIWRPFCRVQWYLTWDIEE